MTWELRALVEWCRALSTGDEPQERVFTVTEPDIQFEAFGAGESLRLRVLFQLEYRPPGLPFARPKDSPAEADADDVVIDFTPGLAGIGNFADALDAELVRFPVRR